MACCNTTAVVDRDLKNQNRNSSNLLGLKEYIKMKVIGLGWVGRI